MGCVYKLTIRVTGLSYIGKTDRTFAERLRDHKNISFSKGRSRGSYSYYIHNSIRKYGWDAVDSEILFESDDHDILCEKEIQYIAEYNTIRPYGYNLTPGGDGVRHTPEMREHKRELASAFHADEERHSKWLEAVTSAETKQKHSDRNIRLFSDPAYVARWKQACAAARAHRSPENVARTRAARTANLLKYIDLKYGSPSDRRKRKEEKLQQKKTQSAINKEVARRKLMQPTICVTTGRIYESIKAAALAEGVPPGYARAVVCGRQKSACGKIFAYYDQKEPNAA